METEHERQRWADSHGPIWNDEPTVFEIQPRFKDADLRRYVRVLRMLQRLHGAGYQLLRVYPYIYDGLYTGRIEIFPRAAFDANGWTRDHMKLWDDERIEFAGYTSASENEYFGWSDCASDTAEDLARKFVERFPRLASAGQGYDFEYAGWFTAFVGQIRDHDTSVFFTGTDRRPQLGVPAPPPKPRGEEW